MKSLVVIPSSSVKKFGEKLLPSLRARGVFAKGEGDVVPWLIRWLESPTGFFWGTLSKRPQVNGVYLVHPRQSKLLEGDGFEIRMRVGDCSTKFVSKKPLQESVGVRITGVSRDRVDVELCSEPPVNDSPFDTEFRVFHTADGVTGQLEAFVGTNAMQLVDVSPNELMAMGLLFQLPEKISVRKKDYPVRAILWGIGADPADDAYQLQCVCHNCKGDGTMECEKCDGAGHLTCTRCAGSGHVDCKKCDGTGTITLPARDVTCKKCGGSGNYYRNGDYVGECRSCDGSGSIHFDEHDVECSACDGTGHWECKGCKGAGLITCFACHGKGEFECWICKGTGHLNVLVDFKRGRFFRKYKEETTWLSASDVFFHNDSDDEQCHIAGCWTDIRQAAERQMCEDRARKDRSDRIVRDGETIDGCLDRVLRLSPAIVKPFEIKNPVAVPGRKANGRVFYEFDARGDSPWLSPKGDLVSDSGENLSDQDKALGPFSARTHVSFDGVVVPEGRAIVYEGCDETGRKLVFSFPVEVDLSSLTERKILVKPDVIPPPEKREKERLGFWLENKGSAIFQGLIEGVEECRVGVKTFMNEGISRFPVQVDAIRQGLSDAPVLLLKGPPGTGKTTVIVEMIRQAVRQGKRVLLTSQTHQAVDNVLERLHKFRESGEDRTVRMAVYSASESRLSDLGRRYMAGGQEEESCEIRERAESVLDQLEEACVRNRTIRGLLADGQEAALRLEERLAKRDTDILVAEAERDNDLELISRNHDEAMAKEKATFAEFEKENGVRREVVSQNINVKEKEIQTLESKCKRLEDRIQRRSTESRFAIGSQLGKSLWGTVDSAIHLIDKIAGTCLDPEKARLVLQDTNAKLDTLRIEKKMYEEKLQSEEDEFREKSTAHGVTCSAIESKKSAELAVRRKVCERTCAAINDVADTDVAQIRESQQKRLNSIIETGGTAEAKGLGTESKHEAWGTDIDRLDNEFSNLDNRRKFMLDWVSELKASPHVLFHFLNAQTNVFFATCVGMGSWRALIDGTYEMRDEGIGGTGRTVFDIAIVDEAGHATFAETVVPLCSAKKVVLIGDDKQLPPMLGEDLDCRRDMDNRCDSCAVSADGRQCWYEYSMFQYLWENDKAFKLPRLMLDTQFRMHPDIADFISETFYEGRLKNGVAAADRKFSFGSFRDPVCLLSTSSQSNRFEVWRGKSCTNPLEVELVCGIVEELASSLEDGTIEGGAGRPLSLAVITPYAAQEALLKMKLSHCYRSSGHFEFSAEDIASVDRFQGDERDVVIASFVRSPRQNLKGGRRTPKLTFVHDLKRMNVAFSRARRMLIMVGDIKALESAPGNERGRAAFARFHEHVDRRGRQILVWERRAR